MSDMLKKACRERSLNKKSDKSFQNAVLIIISMVVFVILIVGTIHFFNYAGKEKDRVVYSSETMMLDDLCGIWQLIFLEPRMDGTAILIFNKDYTYSYGALKEDGSIEVISTYKYSIEFEKSMINCEKEDKKFDIIDYNENRYVRTNINGDEIDNWMIYRKIE